MDLAFFTGTSSLLSLKYLIVAIGYCRTKFRDR